MAYGYYPQYYQPTVQQYQGQMPNMAQTAPQTAYNTSAGNVGGITWVQGESAAKSYPVAAGQSVLLMDSESSVMYIKSTDQSGIPLPLRVFDYKERVKERPEGAGMAQKDGGEYITRKEFDEFKEDVKRSVRGIRRPRVDEAEEEKNA